MKPRHHVSRVSIAALLLAAAALAQAPLPDRLDESIRAIFEHNEFAAEPFVPPTWLDGGRRYASLTPGAQRDLVISETSTGASQVLVRAEQLTPPGGGTPLAVRSYILSPDRSRMLIFTNTRRVWRQHTRGDYWVYDVKSRSLRKLGGDAGEATLMFAKFSPDGRTVGYVRDNNVFVEDPARATITQLTRDGNADIVNGTSDWVNEEELDLRDAFRFSPDSRHVAYWQFDTSGVERFALVNYTDALYPTITRFPYPKPGTKNSAVRAGVVPVTGGETRWLNVPGDPREHYIARMEWIDAETLVLQHLNRLQNRNDLLLADARSRDVRRIFRDTSDAWVDVSDPMRTLNGGKELLFLSERDGWRHAYAVPREGREPRLLTRFDGDVVSVEGVDESAGRLYFIASPENATQRYLYSASLNGPGGVERVTPPDQPGTHTYEIAPDGRAAAHIWSRAGVPPRIDLIGLPEHQSLRTLVTNEGLLKRLERLGAAPIEFFRVDLGGGVRLDGYLLKPRSFDPARKYPVIVHVYGEPAGTTVNDRWGGDGLLFHRALAEAGYLVVSFDNRGTPAPKGAAWRKVVYGTVGELSSKEQATAIEKLAAERAYIDRDRIGIYGASGGGSNTLNSMFRYPKVYKTGVAIAPVPDQRLYDTIYQERYMGLPHQNERGYFVGSPINFAEGLDGRLLIVHGTGDDNVHHQGTERLVNRLIELGKTFDVMFYPNRTHALSEGKGTTVHLRRLIARYFLEHLPAGPR